jgi:hypothetical protein
VLVSACLVALGVTLPFALIDMPAFIKSVVTAIFCSRSGATR